MKLSVFEACAMYDPNGLQWITWIVSDRRIFSFCVWLDFRRDKMRGREIDGITWSADILCNCSHSHIHSLHARRCWCNYSNSSLIHGIPRKLNRRRNRNCIVCGQHQCYFAFSSFSLTKWAIRNFVIFFFAFSFYCSADAFAHKSHSFRIRNNVDDTILRAMYTLLAASHWTSMAEHRIMSLFLGWQQKNDLRDDWRGNILVVSDGSKVFPLRIHFIWMSRPTKTSRVHQTWIMVAFPFAPKRSTAVCSAKIKKNEKFKYFNSSKYTVYCLDVMK